MLVQLNHTKGIMDQIIYNNCWFSSSFKVTEKGMLSNDYSIHLQILALFLDMESNMM